VKTMVFTNMRAYMYVGLYGQWDILASINTACK